MLIKTVDRFNILLNYFVRSADKKLMNQ